MKHNPDNRKDNVDNIQNNIDSTIKNINLADEMIDKTSDEKARNSLIEKNKRRQHALEGLRKEIKDEAEYQRKSKFE